MKTKFHYGKKETYTGEEVAKLLDQAESAVLASAREGYVPSTELEELKTQKEAIEKELTGFRTKETDSIKEKIGREILGENYDKGSKYVNFEEGFDFSDEAAVKAKFTEMNEELFPTVVDDEHETATQVHGKKGGEEQTEKVLSDEDHAILFGPQ